jgi:hypothetical protein
MFAPSNAIAYGPLPAMYVPTVAPLGETTVTVFAPLSATHMLVPSNAIEVGLVPAGYVPTAPHVAGVVVGWQAARAALQPPGRDAMGPSGARQSGVAAVHALHGAVAQSLSATHVAQRPLPSQTMPPLSAHTWPLGAFAVPQQPASQVATRQLVLVAGQANRLVQGVVHAPPVDEAEAVDVAPPVSPELLDALAELVVVPPVPGKSLRGFTEHAGAIATAATMQAPTAT